MLVFNRTKYSDNKLITKILYKPQNDLSDELKQDLSNDVRQIQRWANSKSHKRFCIIDLQLQKRSCCKISQLLNTLFIFKIKTAKIVIEVQKRLFLTKVSTFVCWLLCREHRDSNYKSILINFKAQKFSLKP